MQKPAQDSDSKKSKEKKIKKRRNRHASLNHIIPKACGRHEVASEGRRRVHEAMKRRGHPGTAKAGATPPLSPFPSPPSRWLPLARPHEQHARAESRKAVSPSAIMHSLPLHAKSSFLHPSFPRDGARANAASALDRARHRRSASRDEY